VIVDRRLANFSPSKAEGQISRQAQVCFVRTNRRTAPARWLGWR
jgi:hypothetical protein